MAAANFRVDASKATSGVMGPGLLNIIETLNQAFAQLLLYRAAMIQQRDASNGVPADWLTMSGIFGFVDNTDAISDTVGQAAFAAIDSMQSTCAASLQQMCAQFKQ